MAWALSLPRLHSWSRLTTTHPQLSEEGTGTIVNPMVSNSEWEGGPIPSFYWGGMPLPTLGEYVRRKREFDLFYSIPCYLTGLLCTLIGCGVTPRLVPSRPPSSASAFSRAAVTTFALLLVLAIASDLGSLRNTWRSPLFLLQDDYDRFQILALAKVFLPASILSGLIAAAKHWLPPHRHDPVFSAKP